MPNQPLLVACSEIRTASCPYCGGQLVRVGDWCPTPSGRVLLGHQIYAAKYWCRNCAKATNLFVGDVDGITDIVEVLNACT